MKPSPPKKPAPMRCCQAMSNVTDFSAHRNVSLRQISDWPAASLNGRIWPGKRGAKAISAGGVSGEFGDEQPATRHGALEAREQPAAGVRIHADAVGHPRHRGGLAEQRIAAIHVDGDGLHRGAGDFVAHGANSLSSRRYTRCLSRPLHRTAARFPLSPPSPARPRRTPARRRATPARRPPFAPAAPRIVSTTRALPKTAVTSQLRGAIRTAMIGTTAPAVNAAADASAACTGLAAVTSVMPNSSRRCASTGSPVAISCLATSVANFGSSPRST